MADTQYANQADLAALETQHNDWIDNVDVSHIKPLGDDWKDHPFWADDEAIRNKETAAGKVVAEMQQEFTPAERAESCKEAGNELLKKGQQIRRKLIIRQAVDKYSEGLALLTAADAEADAEARARAPPQASSTPEHADTPPPHAKLRCALHSNRSHAEGLLGNWRNSLDSASWALRCDGAHIKSYFRAAKAAQQLKQWQVALEWCTRGLTVEVAAAELQSIQKMCEEEVRKEEQRQVRERAVREAKIAPYRAAARCIMSRGYRVTRPQFGFQRNSGSCLPWLNRAAVLHFPVMLFYPEMSPYHDTIEDCSEEDTIGAHMDEMFGPAAPALPWDEAGVYSRRRVQLFYCSHAGTVLKEPQLVDVLQGKFPEKYVEIGCQKYGDKISCMKRVDEAWTFRDLLRQADHVMPGIPVLWVVADGTGYRDKFLRTFDPHGA